MDRDRRSPAGSIPARRCDLDDALLPAADFLRFEVALIELGDKRIRKIGGVHRPMECLLVHGFVLHELIHSQALSCV